MRRDSEKEIWLLPCDYEGFLTVYFNTGNDMARDSLFRRVYQFNEKGICYSGFGNNNGFSSDLKRDMLIRAICDTGEIVIPYYDNSELDTVKANYFATRLIVGKRGNRSYQSIFIKKIKSQQKHE